MADPITWREIANHPDIAELRQETGIEKAIAKILYNYNIHPDNKDHTLKLINEYATTRDRLRKAIKRWEEHRGRDDYELDVLLYQEEPELHNIEDFIEDHNKSATELREFLLQQTRGKQRPKLPKWYKNMVHPYQTPKHPDVRQ